MAHDWLTGRRRVAEATEGTPDCVPIYGPMPEHARYLTAVPTESFYTSPELFVEAQLLLFEYYGLDLPYLGGDVHNIEAEALGRRVIYRPRSAPLLEPGPPLLQSRTDVERLQTPDPHAAGRMPFALEVYRLAGERTGFPADRWFCAPFSLVCAVQGFPRVAHDALHDPAFLHGVMSALVERVLAPWIRCGLHQPPQSWAAIGHDPWATFPIISERLYRDFVWPYADMLHDSFAGEGCQVVLASGWGEARVENPIPILEERIRLRGALRGLDPDVQRLGPDLYAEVAARHGVALGLALDARLLRDGPIEAIVARVKHYIDRAGRNGRLSLIINHVPGDTPTAHLHAAVAATRLYGSYPIADNLDAIPFVMPAYEPFADFARRRGWALGQREGFPP